MAPVNAYPVGTSIRINPAACTILGKAACEIIVLLKLQHLWLFQPYIQRGMPHGDNCYDHYAGALSSLSLTANQIEDGVPVYDMYG